MNNTVVIRCEAEGFTGNWIEYRSAWTRREIEGLNGNINEDFLKLIRPKIVALNVELPTGMTIDRAENLTVENLFDVDILLWAWVSESPLIAIAMRAGLGKASGRPSFSHNGVTQAKSMTVQTQP